MSMIKVIQPHAQDFSEPVASLIKISSRGIIGADKQALIKRAGAEFAHKLDNIKFAKDEVPVHLIAIGATEDYGPNRNGDGFTRDCCRNYHQTFEKFARFYRDHANKNPAKSFGIVKASAYHEPMKRIELVCALNGSKEAAERNGGLIADKEIEKLASGKDIAVSMACKIPFDICSSCGNKARTRAEYCDSLENSGHCKAGGLKHNIGKVLSDGHVLHADNPNPTFFDISHVFRPADRIAYVSGKLEKAASAAVLSGAELAEQLGITVPPLFDLGGNSSKRAQLQLDALNSLAQAEAEQNAAEWTKVALASSQAVQPAIDATACASVKMSEVLRGLADAGVVLPVRDFLSLTVKTASENLIGAVVQALPNIFSKLANDVDIVSKLEHNAYYPANTASTVVRVWAEKIAQTHSVLPGNVEKRAYLAALRNVNTGDLPTEKQATGSAETALAQHYALYKIAAFAAICEKHGNNLLTANHCVLQNYIM
ncbi:hypothetical protein EBZ39_01755 [bacterium]|nr:hypothetical protein [bacterium]